MKKLCFLVGGSRGLGQSLDAVYREAGFDVIEFSRSGESDGHVHVDLSRRETAIDTVDAQFAQQAAAEWSEVHLVLNAAVIGPLGPLAGSEPKDWWSHMDINMVLPISIAGRFQHHFSAGNARRVLGFVSSGVANRAIDGWSLYGATKAGVEQFIRSMALEQEMQSNPIHCVNLDPGVMDTEMQATIRTTSESAFSGVQRFIDRHKNGELADTAEVATNILQTLQQEFANGSTVDVSAR